MNLTEQFKKAVQFALTAHAGQLRKGTQVPYASHLLSVAGIVLDYGGNNDEAIAALLHDCIEDRGVSSRQIEERFGMKVAAIVVACSDSLERDPSKKAPWLERKEAYLKHLTTAPPAVLLVSIADKLHNARSILKDFRETGDEVWKRFKANKRETLWYYGSLVRIFRARGCHPMLVDELARTVDELQRLAKAKSTSDSKANKEKS